MIALRYLEMSNLNQTKVAKKQKSGSKKQLKNVIFSSCNIDVIIGVVRGITNLEGGTVVGRG